MVAPLSYSKSQSEESGQAISYRRLVKALRASDNIEVVELPAFSAYEGHQAVLSAYQENHIDLVHAFVTGKAAYGAIYAAKLLSLPTVLGLRSELGLEDSDDMIPGSLGFLRWQFVNADRLISSSHELQKRASILANRPTIPGKIVMNSIDSEVFLASVSNTKSREQQDREMLGVFNLEDVSVPKVSLPPNVPVVGAIASDWSRSNKGLFVLLDAVHRLTLTRFADLHLLVIGKAGDKAATLNTHVAATGPINYNMVVRYMRLCHVGVVPSIQDSNSNAVLEWMAAGVPLVATNTGMNKEILRDTGLVVQPGNPQALANAIELLLQMAKGPRQRIAQSARDMALTRFDPRFEANSYIRAYQDLLENADTSVISSVISEINTDHLSQMNRNRTSGYSSASASASEDDYPDSGGLIIGGKD